MPARSTASLLTGTAAGDAAATDELFARHGPRLRLYIAARLGRRLAGRIEADDVVQESLLRALPVLASFEARGDGAFLRLLCTIAGHVLADVARAARRQRRDAPVLRLDRADWSRVGVSESAVAGLGPGPATRAMLSESEARLEAAFAQLSTRHRRAIALRQFEGRSGRELAVLLSCSEAAAHALYRRALLAWAEAAGEGDAGRESSASNRPRGGAQ